MAIEKPRQFKASMNRCEKLRWKAMFIDAEPDPEAEPASSSGYWCQHTFTCLGPDGKIVDDFECSPARGCYEAL